MSRSKRSPRVALLVAALGIALGGVALAAPPVPSEPTTTTGYPSRRVAATYAVYDAQGKRTGTARWHWTPTGGNCCEVYVTATANGTLLEYGGSYPYSSADLGKTWKRVNFATPLYNGEGAIVAGPHGDAFGISWDPYTGDHLQGVKYTAATKTWQTAEAPIKSPFFDREWITYSKGPFVVDGQQVPYVTLVRGGTVTKTLEVLSTDGLSYLTPTDPNLDVSQSSTELRTFTIPVVKNPDADYWQPNPGTFTLPLSGGGVLLLNNAEDDLGADAARLNPTTLKWERVRLPFRPTGTVRQDSRGWLTMVTRTKNDLTLAVSANGGRSWKETDLVLPPNLTTVEGTGDFFDVKVNGKLGQAVVSTRVDNKAGRGQDLVWRVDVSKPQPRVLKLYGVGLGNAPTAIGLVAGLAADRFDFPSVALLPDGRIAVSFQDATTPRNIPVPGVPTTGQFLNPAGGHNPALAILD
jgi:hypothetical protein